MNPSYITFVGIGAIGLPMATLLQQAGHQVHAIDPSPMGESHSAQAGLAGWSPSITATETGGVVVVMVATPDQLGALVDEALLDPVRMVTDRTWIIMSTVGPASVTHETERLAAAGARVIDAPVTGGVARALTGELLIFAAGALPTISPVEPLLEVLGRVTIVGERIGDGQKVKVVNQHLCAIHIVAAAEALNLADAMGLDPSAVLGLVEAGAGGSWMLSDRGPRMLLSTDAPVTSTVGIFVKDSALAAAAAAAGAAVPLLDVAQFRFREAAAVGLALRDDSRVIETYTAVPAPLLAAEEGALR